MYRSWQAFPGCVWSGRNFKREQNLGCKAAHMVCLRGEEALGHPFNRYGKPRLCYLHLLQRLCHLVPVPKEYFFYAPLLFVGSYPWTAVFPCNRQRIMIQQHRKKIHPNKAVYYIETINSWQPGGILSCYWFSWQGADVGLGWQNTKMKLPQVPSSASSSPPR
jgi:hypothetical protein